MGKEMIGRIETVIRKKFMERMYFELKEKKHK